MLDGCDAQCELLLCLEAVWEQGFGVFEVVFMAFYIDTFQLACGLRPSTAGYLSSVRRSTNYTILSEYHIYAHSQLSTTTSTLPSEA